MTIFEQIIKARQEIENPPLDSSNPHFGNDFASLLATLSVVNRATLKNGICYEQNLIVENGESYIRTWVFNGKGETVELSMMPTPNRDNPQQGGSDLTYRKRQLAQLDWGIVGEVDDDGETAVKPTKSKKSDREGVTALKAKAVMAGVDVRKIDAWFSKRGYKGKKPSELTEDDLACIREYLNDLIAGAKAMKEE